MKNIKYIAVVLMLLWAVGCEYADDDRIPSAAVRIEFGNAAMWSVYGVSAYPDYRVFIKSENKPKGFTYVANSATGYGGVMLVCTPTNVVLAYDMSCPVERSSTMRIEYDAHDLVLRCPHCGSTYDISTGSPLSGAALKQKYLLQQYAVYFNAMGGVLVTR